jgi:hypothetical protein
MVASLFGKEESGLTSKKAESSLYFFFNFNNFLKKFQRFFPFVISDSVGLSRLYLKRGRNRRQGRPPLAAVVAAAAAAADRA